MKLCVEIRAGKIWRRETLRTHGISANLMKMWLTHHARGDLNAVEVAADAVWPSTKETPLEREIGQLTMELESLKNGPELFSSATTSHHPL